MENITLLEEAVQRAIPEEIKKKLRSRTVRAEMLKKYGNRAFLLPKTMKFPIVNPINGIVDCRLIYASFVRARQWESKNPAYKRVAELAKGLFRKYNCSIKTGIHIEESIMIGLSKIGFSDLLDILNGDVSDAGISPETDANEVCKCSTCDFTTGLSTDSESCDMQDCPNCGEKMESFEGDLEDDLDEEEDSEDEDYEEEASSKLRSLAEEIIEPPKGTPKDKFHCSACKTTANYLVKEQLSGKCPVCSDKNMLIMYENIETGSRDICPKCETSYSHSHTTKECKVCDSFTQTIRI